MRDITAQQIIKWQNTLIEEKDENGKAFSPVYLRTINSALSAIFNHAEKYYGCVIILAEKRVVWERRKIVKCSSGQKRSI